MKKKNFILFPGDTYGNLDKQFNRNITNFTNNFRETVKPGIYGFPHADLYRDEALDSSTYFRHGELEPIDEIKLFLRDIGLNVNKAEINKRTHVVDYDGNVNIYGTYKRLPVKFGHVNGWFDCSCCGLETLDGCPDFVKHSFICSDNNLKNLIGGPKQIDGFYDAGQNFDLISFEGVSDVVQLNWDILNSNISSLENGPTVIGKIILIGTPLAKEFEENKNEFLLKYPKYHQSQIIWKT